MKYLGCHGLINLEDNLSWTVGYSSVVSGSVPENIVSYLEKKHPKVITLGEDSLQNTLHVLKKFGIGAEDACLEPHIFCMNPISMDNYGEILKECNFTVILPKHIVRYFNLINIMLEIAEIIACSVNLWSLNSLFNNSTYLYF